MVPSSGETRRQKQPRISTHAMPRFRTCYDKARDMPEFSIGIMSISRIKEVKINSPM